VSNFILIWQYSQSRGGIDSTLRGSKPILVKINRARQCWPSTVNYSKYEYAAERKVALRWLQNYSGFVLLSSQNGAGRSTLLGTFQYW